MAASLLLLAALAADPGADLVGKPAPPLAGDALDGRPLRLADLDGKVVVLHFWALWCQPCRDCAADLRRLRERYRDRGAEVLAVTRYYEDFAYDKGTKRVVEAKAKLTREQERETLRDFAAAQRLEYRQLVLGGDAAREAFAAYGARRLPLTVVLDRRGQVRLVKVGAGKDVSEAVDRAVREALDEAGRP
jgi:peroxiredoxin